MSYKVGTEKEIHFYFIGFFSGGLLKKMRNDVQSALSFVSENMEYCTPFVAVGLTVLVGNKNFTEPLNKLVYFRPVTLELSKTSIGHQNIVVQQNLIQQNLI